MGHFDGSKNRTLGDCRLPYICKYSDLACFILSLSIVQITKFYRKEYILFMQIPYMVPFFVLLIILLVYMISSGADFYIGGGQDAYLKDFVPKGKHIKMDGINADILVAETPVNWHKNTKMLEYMKHIPEVLELERKLDEGCQKKLLSDDFGTRVVDGYECVVIPTGTKLYKTTPGFVTSKMYSKYISGRKSADPSWFTSDIAAYAIAISSWSSINAYKLKKELVLFDFHNEGNLLKIFDICDKNGEIGKEVKNHIILRIGYKYDLKKRLQTYSDSYNRWKEIWYFPSVLIPERGIGPCKAELPPPNMMPASGIGFDIELTTEMFRMLAPAMENIDGMIKKPMRSYLHINGYFQIEELAIRFKALQDGDIVLDETDPLCWKNWKLGFDVGEEGISLGAISNKVTAIDVRDYDFKVSKFMIFNKFDQDKLPSIKSPAVFAYNVHGYISLDNNIKIEDNVRNISDMLTIVLKKYDIKIFAILEHDDEIYPKIPERYIKICEVKNGSRIKSNKQSKIIVFGDKKYHHKKIIPHDTPGAQHAPKNREGAMIFYGKISVLFVHLEIGIQIGMGKFDDSSPKYNSYIRIEGLKSFLKHSPDIIIGDFNFTIDDEEHQFLIRSGYVLMDKTNENSTPYNRVDHAYYKKISESKIFKGSTPDGSYLIPNNFSDHFINLAPVG